MAEHAIRQQPTEASAEERLELLAELGYALIEAGQTSGQTARTLRECARAIGLGEADVRFFGALLTIEATTPEGLHVTRTGAAASIDVIDCARSSDLDRLAARLLRGGLDEAGLRTARLAVQRIRARRTPWWWIATGMTALAFFICLQVGVTWNAWITAAAAQLLASLVGAGAGALRMPRLFAAALQTAASGALVLVLAQQGLVDAVGAAAALAVNWLLVLPLPQVVGAMSDVVEGEYHSALTRLSGVAVSAGGILIGGAFTFDLRDRLGIDHPLLDQVPGMPWYLGLVFAALGAVANAFANGGRLSLVAPAALLGATTAATSQLLALSGALPSGWIGGASAVVLGFVAVLLAPRTGYPYQVLALMGITGALLPGFTVFLGIVRAFSGGDGVPRFAEAAGVCLGLGVGAAFGVYLASLLPLPGVRARFGPLRSR